MSATQRGQQGQCKARMMRRALAFAIAGMAPLFATVAAFAPVDAFAQGSDIVVRGRVVASDNAPIAIAQVIDANGIIRARVNERGEFTVRAPRGATLRVRALGYRAQPVSAADTAVVVRLEQLPTVLSVLTTTVGARELRANESPRGVTVLQREDIDAVAAVSANQLLRQVPGLQEVASPPSKTSISIRGFSDSRVLVLIDGEPVTGSLIDSRDIGRLSTLSTERIEVTKGPSSVEFGSDALGGVINLVQAAPTKGLSLDGQLRSGALGRREGQGEASQTIGRLGYRIGGSWRQVDRLPGLDSEGVTFNRVYDARGDFRLRATNQLSLRLSVLGSQERQRWPVDRAFNGFIDNRGGQGFLEAHYSGLGGSLRARAFEQRFSYQYRQSRDLLPIANSADSLEQEERQRRYLLAYSRVIGAHTLDVGAQRSARNMVSPQKVAGDSAQDVVNEVFLRDSWTRGPILLTAGARHSSSSLWGSSTNPSVGLAWQASDAWRIRSNVSRGFRAPSFKDIRYTHINANIGYALFGNPDLEPESSVSSTLGATWAPSSKLSVDAELYRNDVRDMIEIRYTGVNNAGLQEYRYVNVSDARTAGIETNVRATVGEFTLAAGYDFVRARDLSNNLPLSRRASHTARVQAARNWNVLSGLQTDLSARYTGSAPLVGNSGTGGTYAGGGIDIVGAETPVVVARQDAFLSVDMQLRLSVTRFSELSAGVNNLLGARPDLWTPAFQRQVYAGLRLRYAAD